MPRHHGSGGGDPQGVALSPDIGGSHLPTWGEWLLLWMVPQDPTSIPFSLDDAAMSIERESLNGGILAMVDVLNQAKGVLCDVIVPTGRVST